jgi:hypothetical protein
LETTHVVTHVPNRKRNRDGGGALDPDSLKTIDMEVDECYISLL